MKEVKVFEKEQLKVKVLDTREEMGIVAAKDVVNRIRQILTEKNSVNMIFAAAPSQNEFLKALIEEDVDWSRIRGFHMDEYVGLNKDHPERFGNYLKTTIFDKVPFQDIYLLNGVESDAEKESSRYSQLLTDYPADIVCMGIGENAHIAFNDPSEADFNDPVRVKEVQLDKISRMQQVHDGCFTDINKVPLSAVTLTVPALMEGRYIYCMVPGVHKAEAVYHTLHDKVSEKYPSTVLRKHKHATLYLDKESAEKL